MGVQISYMGTKRDLAGVVAEVARSLPDGPMLDAFSGMCAVGEAVAPARPIWTNDLQIFPAIVAKCLFTARAGPPVPEIARDLLERDFHRNLAALESRFERSLTKESAAFSRKTLAAVSSANTALPYVGTDKALSVERRRLARKPGTFPYRLASITYVGSFFGVRQCMEIDSLRYAIDCARTSRLGRQARKWFLVALGQVASRINSSTGQFAQFLRPSQKNMDRILQKRRRSVWEEFFRALGSISPIGDADWRNRNMAFQSDALTLLGRLRGQSKSPAIVYADPPYSKEQYSRYYHVLDVLVRYRYPKVTGMGRYAEGRHQTSFALAKAVSKAVEQLVEKAARLRASLILSYPTNGLLCRCGGDAMTILREHYSHVSIAYSATRYHSTFGGPKAKWKVPATEQIYVAQR